MFETDVGADVAAKQTAGGIGSLGLIGGTGPLGRGLAERIAHAGIEVRIGSRDPVRAEAAASEIRTRLGTDGAKVVGVHNVEVATADVIVVALPFGGVDGGLATMGTALVGRIVVSAVNPIGFDDVGPHPLRVEDGSAAEAIQARLPGARVVAAFHTLSSRQLQRMDEPMRDDVPVVGDDADAVATVVALADSIHGCRGVAAGPLRLSSTLESLTPLLIEVNRRNRTQAGIRFTRL